MVPQWFIYCLKVLSVHEGKITLDFFTFSLSVDNEKIKDIIKDYFIVNAFRIDAYYFTRGS